MLTRMTIDLGLFFHFRESELLSGWIGHILVIINSSKGNCNILGKSETMS